MYTTNHLDKVRRIDMEWFNMGVEIMNVGNHLDVHVQPS